jgi:hypothetical protein
LVALAVVVVAGWVAWRRPILGLAVLVAGMAFHNFLLMVLLRLGTSHVLVRVVQLWKEGLLALLLVIVGLRLLRAYREGRLGRPMALDVAAAIFLAIMVIYLLLPSGVLGSSASLQGRLASFRIVALMPVLYGLGRTFQGMAARDLRIALWLVVGAASVVGAFGVVELWLIPTRAWLDWGVNDFSAWLGYQYHGPQSLPENFFQTLGVDVYLRRMVSTYLSPLGVAYTALLVLPMAVVLAEGRSIGRRTRYAATVAVALIVTSILFSVTRLAIFAMLGEVALLAFLIRRPFTYGLGSLTVVASVLTILFYATVGPVVDHNLNPTALPGAGVVRAGDPSFAEHLRTMEADFRVAVRHPLGEGLGSSGSSANRFSGGAQNPNYAPGESAVLSMFVDTGILGGVAYLTLYLLGIYVAARRIPALVAGGTLESALPLAAFVGGLALVPITLTSDVWGDLSVTFLFWWAVGYAAGLAAAGAPISWRAWPAWRVPNIASS